MANKIILSDKLPPRPEKKVNFFSKILFNRIVNDLTLFKNVI